MTYTQLHETANKLGFILPNNVPETLAGCWLNSKYIAGMFFIVLVVYMVLTPLLTLFQLYHGKLPVLLVHFILATAGQSNYKPTLPNAKE